MKFSRKILKATIPLVVFAILFYGVVCLLSADVFRVAKVEVQSTDSSSEVFARIKLSLEQKTQLYLGQPLWRVNVERLGQQAKKEKWVQKVHVSRAWPNTLRVWVQTKDVAFYLLHKGRAVPVAVDGSLLPTTTEHAGVDAPFLMSQAFFQDLSLRIRAIQILESLPEEGGISRASVSDVEYDKKEGFSLHLNGAERDQRVLLGEELASSAVPQVEKVLSYLRAQKLRAQVIDARLGNKVLVKLRKGP